MPSPHAVTHDVAYEALPPERRADLHRRIALAIEALDADRVPGQDEILAHHFSKAEEWPKALKYLVRAAEKAASAFAIREALALYDQALEAVDRLGRARGRADRDRDPPGEVRRSTSS